MQLEQRDATLFSTDAATELRYAEAAGETPHRFVGVIPFNSLSADLGGFKERLMPTAFRSTIAGGADIRALADHDSAKLLGRTSNRTLRVSESPAGLAVEIDLPDTSYARDLRELVKRRDVRGLSFGFKCRANGQRFLREGGLTIRELHDVDLREVSIVSQPAYAETSLAIRSAEVDQEVAAMLQNLNSRFPRMATAKSRLVMQTIE